MCEKANFIVHEFNLADSRTLLYLSMHVSIFYLSKMLQLIFSEMTPNRQLNRIAVKFSPNELRFSGQFIPSSSLNQLLMNTKQESMIMRFNSV